MILAIPGKVAGKRGRSEGFNCSPRAAEAAKKRAEESLTGSGEGGLRALLANYQSEASEVSVLDEGVALDMDTPSELVRVRGLAVRRRANLADCAAGKQPEG